MSRPERAISDVRDLFGVSRRRSQATEDAERQITELFGDLHIHAGTKRDSAFSDDEGDLSNNKRYDKNRNDLQHIERHLSMKKTIRKRMMRDLQRAFVEDPNQCGPEAVETIGSDCRTTDVSLLDMLRGQDNENLQNSRSDESDKKVGFWKKLTMKRVKR